MSSQSPSEPAVARTATIARRRARGPSLVWSPPRAVLGRAARERAGRDASVRLDVVARRCRTAAATRPRLRSAGRSTSPPGWSATAAGRSTCSSVRPADGPVALAQPLPPRVQRGRGRRLGRSLYVIGGNAPDDRRSPGLRVRHPPTRRGGSVLRCPQPRTNLAAVALGDKVYAIGGLDPVNPVQTVFAYDAARETWSEVAPLPEAIHAMAATVFKGEIWVLGGRLAEPGDHLAESGSTTRSATAGGRPVDARADGPARGRRGREQDRRVLESKYFVYDAATRRWRRGPSLRVRVTRSRSTRCAAGCTRSAAASCPQLEDSPAVETLRLTG